VRESILKTREEGGGRREEDNACRFLVAALLGMTAPPSLLPSSSD
jgi:hypothetical protein